MDSQSNTGPRLRRQNSNPEGNQRQLGYSNEFNQDFDKTEKLQRENNMTSSEPEVLNRSQNGELEKECPYCSSKSLCADIPKPSHLAAMEELDPDDTECTHRQPNSVKEFKSQKRTFLVRKTKEEDFLPASDGDKFFLSLPAGIDRLDSDEDQQDSIQSNSSGRVLLARSAVHISSIDHLPTVPEVAFGSCPSIISPKYVIKDAKVAHLLQGDQLPKKEVYIKNLLVLSISISFTLLSFVSIRSLQSSINHDGGLGLFSLSAFYGTFMLSCTLAPLIISKLRPKWTMFFGICGHIFYNAANLLPTYFTLIPASCIAGFGTSSMLIAQGTYISSIAASYSIITKKKFENVMTIFQGVYIVFIQIGQTAGNVISSLILRSQSVIDPNHVMEVVLEQNRSMYLVEGVLDDESIKWNTSICGANYCHSIKLDASSFRISHTVLYVLIGTYTASIVLALLIHGIFLDKLDIIFQSSKKKSIRKMMTGVFGMLKDEKMRYIYLLVVYLALSQGITFGDITKAFVTCSLGMDMLGYVIIANACSSCLSAMFTGVIKKYTGRPPLIVSAGIGSLCLLILMLLWKPSPSQPYLFFVLFGCIGIVDGIFLTEVNSMIGTMFTKKRESAFGFYRMNHSLTLAVTFGLSSFVCMREKIYIAIGVLIISQIMYIILEIKLRKQKQNDLTEPVNV